MKNNIATLIVIVMLAVFALPAKAQQFNTFNRAVAPQASFQSTSTMVGTGSAYSSNPMLNSDGTATYNGAVASTPSDGPYKAKKAIDPSEDAWVPIGDAVLPLMLCVCAYLIYMYYRRRRRA